MGLDVPFIVHTAVDIPPAIFMRFSELVVRIKPCPAASLVAELELLIADRQRSISAAAGVA